MTRSLWAEALRARTFGVAGDPNPSGNDRIYQNFYDAGVGGTLALQRQVSSDIYYHPSHYHYHFQNFASYLLLKRDTAGV